MPTTPTTRAEPSMPVQNPSGVAGRRAVSEHATYAPIMKKEP